MAYGKCFTTIFSQSILALSGMTILYHLLVGSSPALIDKNMMMWNSYTNTGRFLNNMYTCKLHRLRGTTQQKSLAFLFLYPLADTEDLLLSIWVQQVNIHLSKSLQGSSPRNCAAPKPIGRKMIPGNSHIFNRMVRMVYRAARNCKLSEMIKWTNSWGVPTSAGFNGQNSDLDAWTETTGIAIHLDLYECIIACLYS